MSAAAGAPPRGPGGTRGTRQPAVCRVRATRALRAPFVALLLALLAALGVPPSGLSPASAAGREGEGPATAVAARGNDVQIQLASVTPGVARPGTKVVFKGTLRNLGGSTITTPVVTVHRAVVGLDTRAAVAAWADGSSRADAGPEIARRTLAEPLPGHQSIPFTITVRPGAIQTGYRFTSLGLTLRALAGHRADAQAVGSLRTFLPWDRTSVGSHNPIRMAWVVPLTLPADPDLFGPDSDDRTQAWRRAIGLGSQVDELVSVTADEPVTWALDPTMVAPPPSTGQFPPTGGTPSTSPGQTPTPSGSSGAPTTPSGTSTTPPTTGTSSTGPTDEAAPATSGRATAPDTGAGTEAGSPTSGTVPPTTGPSGGATPPETATTGPGSTPPPEPSEVDQLADALVTRLRTSTGQHPLWAMPFADPDLTALLHLDPSGDTLRHALRRPTPKVLGPAARSDVAWPIEGNLTDKKVAALRRAWKKHGGLGAALVPATALDGTSGYTGSAPRRSAQGLPLLAYDERLSGVFSHLDDPATGGVAVQRFLAESLAVYQEQPATDRSLLVVPPRSFEADPDVLTELFAGVDESPWLTPTSTGALLRAARKAPKTKKHHLSGASATAAPGDITAYPSAHASPLTSRRLRGLEPLRTTTAGIASVLGPGQRYRAIWSAATDQLLSSRWRTGPPAWHALRARISQSNSDIAKGVSVVASTFNFFADQGSLQLTVVNDLDVGVRDLRLTLTPRNPRLRILEQPKLLRIGAHSRTTVKVKVNAISAGLVPVDAHLSTTNGTPLGSQTSVTVRVQPTSTWIYWVLGIVAGLILVLGLARALRRGGHPPTDPGTPQETPEP